jgi:hypothetical protein
MLCEKYLSLTPLERSTFIGKCIHAIQSDSKLFDDAAKMIERAEKRGLFTGVIINPLEKTE